MFVGAVVFLAGTYAVSERKRLCSPSSPWSRARSFLLVGYAWAFAYALLGQWQPGSFSGAVIGQIYLAVLVARLVGLHIVQANRPRSGDKI
jgi:hypothetical protein